MTAGAPAGGPEFTAAGGRLPGVGTDNCTSLSEGAAGALTEPNAPGKGSTGSEGAGTLLISSVGAAGGEAALLELGLLIEDGDENMLRPGELGLLGEVIDGDRAVSGAWGSKLEAPGAPEVSGLGLGSEGPTIGLDVSLELLSTLGLGVRLVAGDAPAASAEPGMLHLLQLICNGQQLLL